jgi:hypothetical protein
VKSAKLAEAEDLDRAQSKLTAGRASKPKSKRRRLPEGGLDSFMRVLGGSNSCQEIIAAVRSGFMTLKRLEAAGDKSDRRSEEDPLLAFPSTHTCMVCNVLAVTDLLKRGSASRFATQGIPAVYLSCALDMDRDDADGTIHTLGPAGGSTKDRTFLPLFLPSLLSLSLLHSFLILFFLPSFLIPSSFSTTTTLGFFQSKTVRSFFFFPSFLPSFLPSFATFISSWPPPLPSLHVCFLSSLPSLIFFPSHLLVPSFMFIHLPAVLGHQELCVQEAIKFPEVRQGEHAI